MYSSTPRRRSGAAGLLKALFAASVLISPTSIARGQTGPLAQDSSLARPALSPAPLAVPSQPRLGAHIMPLRVPASGVHRASSPICNSPSLSYYGGPVTSNVQIVLVNWNSDVASTVQQNMPAFYQEVVESPLLDTLSEYSTNVTPTGGVGGTNQSIGRGSYAGSYTIMPTRCPAQNSSKPTACNLSDAQVQTEITAQINAGGLPASQSDTGGNTNTVYMVNFPPYITISDPYGDQSCVQFCAYHSAFTINSKPILYGILPDLITTACNSGCGSASNPFDNITYVASHELTEAVTDPDVSLDTGVDVAYPIGWYDGGSNNCGEIADICDDGKGTTVTTPQGSFNASSVWSNTKKQCVVTGLHPSLNLNVTGTAVDGEPVDFTVTAKNPAGAKGTDTAYLSTIHFTSTDAQATLPADYTFTEADQGVHTFQATLHAGAKSITATDTGNSNVTVTTGVAVSQSVQVAIGTQPSGLAFTVDNTTYTAPEMFTWAVGSMHSLAATSPQSPSTGVQDNFSSWSDAGAISHTVTAAAATTSYTATFNTSYQLTTAASPTAGGSVAPVSGTYYSSGAVVNLTATPNSGYGFSGWIGPVANSGSASTTVTMNAPESVTANFATATVSVTIATTPAGLPVSIDGGATLNAPLNVQWQAGSQHTIATVGSQAVSGGIQYLFTSWSDGGAVAHSVTAPSSAITYTASFQTLYQLTTAVSPAGAGLVTPHSGSYFAPSSAVNLTATPTVGFIFSSWSGPVTNSKLAATAVTMTAPETVTANFLKIEPTTTTLKSSPNPSIVGQTVTFTATVAVAGGGKATGSVTFRLGSTPLKTVALSSNAAAWSSSSLSIGTSMITAVYSGDTTSKPSTSAALNQVVRKATSTVALTSSLNPSVFHQAVKLTARVKSTPTPTGTVSFFDGTAKLGSAALSAGAATFTTSALPAATHQLKAVYSGDAAVQTSASAILSQVVTRAATTTKLTSSKNPSTSGSAVTFTVAVTSAAGIPSGTVAFKNGTSALGTATLVNGSATFSTSKLPKGSDTITASFGGSMNFKPSAAALAQTVK